MTSPAKKKVAKKEIVKKKSRKIPVATKIKVIKLKCPNCGEEDERVLYCDQCESPMDIVDVIERNENEVNNDIAVSKDISGSDKRIGGDGKVTSGEVIPTEASVGMEQIMEKGLGNIFPGDDSHGDVSGSGGVDGMDLNAALDALDNE